MQNVLVYKEKKLSLFKRIKRKILFLFRLRYSPVIKVYRGYGNLEKITIYGHVLKISPMARKTYRQNRIVNTFSMLRLFMIRPFIRARVSMKWNDKIYEAETEDDGFFKFEWMPEIAPVTGWHNVTVNLNEELYQSLHVTGEGEFYIPFLSQHAFISDIDDTFLISHSSKLRKRLYVLFTKNARSRKPFEGVVNHYCLLSAGQKDHAVNSFFYVSSSEWNLYDLIVEFSKENHLPKGVYLLNQIKKISEVLRTGQNKHSGKFIRIVRIIETYPQLQFILMGDDTQEDPNIYLAIAEHFPKNVYAVYIRRVHKNKFETVQAIIKKMELSGVRCCYFQHSSEAIEHSKAIGLIG
ncbi:MAG: App1 family protein [Bacteroidota bacterium]|nr:App1 family protein [Bacteroidota bacterium]